MKWAEVDLEALVNKKFTIELTTFRFLFGRDMWYWFNIYPDLIRLMGFIKRKEIKCNV